MYMYMYRIHVDKCILDVKYTVGGLIGVVYGTG